MEARAVLNSWQQTLLAWFEVERRDLPWRLTRDPWAILVSEAMLQQTQVARVLERWPQFLQQFPTPAACAAAPMGDVVRAWQGLGYNRRAMNLHRAAVATVKRHGGTLPGTLDELLALPGIGPYTARAVMAFAYERDVAVVDTNVARVLARHQAGQALTAKGVQVLADEQVPHGDGWRWNQAMLDFGATRCRKRVPLCGVCPVKPQCAWARREWAEPDPAIGSAGVTGKQSTFEGSNRQGRGRLIDQLRARELGKSEVAAAAGWPEDEARAQRVMNDLVNEGLVQTADGRYSLA